MSYLTRVVSLKISQIYYKKNRKESLHMGKLKGKRVLITGGAALGIGRCLADLFAKDDCELILTDFNEDALGLAVEELSRDGALVYSYVVDVSNRKEVEGMTADIIENIGKIDILINNAGIGHSGEIIETPLETWKKLMDVNFWGGLFIISMLSCHPWSKRKTGIS